MIVLRERGAQRSLRIALAQILITDDGNNLAATDPAVRIEVIDDGVELDLRVAVGNREAEPVRKRLAVLQRNDTDRDRRVGDPLRNALDPSFV